ncbi:adenine phosphoribosyltransferase [Candidatus Saccharibacteria bacterium]|nr:adenine phosphoribosyltransferase [Candidatus Saccharibacteria bacterium]
MKYNYEDYIRTVEDFPKEGVKFCDIAPLLSNGAVFRASIEDMAGNVDPAVTKLVGFDARGFIFASALAHELALGFVMLRKPGKLPGPVKQASYELEYGTNSIEIQTDVLGEDDVILIVDDVIATGGTALAGIELIRGCGARIEGFQTVIDLPGLGGSDRIRQAGVAVRSLVSLGEV